MSDYYQLASINKEEGIRPTQQRRHRSALNNSVVVAVMTIMTGLFLLTTRSVTCFVTRPVVPKRCGFHCSSVILNVLSPDSTTSTTTDDDDTFSLSGYSRPVIQWYPGHIAKAERLLQETFKAVDVVIEVRDARACQATSHPNVPLWSAGKPRIVAITHVDAIPKAAQRAWQPAAVIQSSSEITNEADKQIQNQAQQAAIERFKYFQQQEQQQLLLTKKKKSTSTTTDNHQSTAGTAGVAVVSPIEHVLFVNAKQGAGIHALKRAIFQAGSHVQEKRRRRGLNERPLRVGVIGYPNVGKSALINRLLGRKRAKTANTPGITRALQWIRVRADTNTASTGKVNTGGSRKEFELLDSPGVIPASLENQSHALLLAACNCIGTAAYDNQAVAAYLCEWLLTVHKLGYGDVYAPTWREQVKVRYGFDPMQDKEVENDSNHMFEEDDDGVPKTRPRTGEDMLYDVADNTCQGNAEDAARKILQDFRAGRMGLICLQVAPKHVEQAEQKSNSNNRLISPQRKRQQEQAEEELRQQQERATRALETAKERGLELPPSLIVKDEHDDQKSSSTKPATSEVGKGLFDGW